MRRAQPVDGRKALRQMAMLDPDAMTLEQWKATEAALERALTSHRAIKPCCHSCAQFDSIEATCAMHGAVPIEFQGAVGECESWVLDPIPF